MLVWGGESWIITPPRKALSRTVIEFKETLIIDFILIFSLYFKRINDFFRNDLKRYEEKNIGNKKIHFLGYLRTCLRMYTLNSTDKILIKIMFTMCNISCFLSLRTRFFSFHCDSHWPLLSFWELSDKWLMNERWAQGERWARTKRGGESTWTHGECTKKLENRTLQGLYMRIF